MTFSLKLSGFNTKAEAEAFFDWYSGAGEQDASVWFECRADEGEIETTFMGTEGGAEWNGDVLEAKLKMHGAEE